MSNEFTIDEDLADFDDQEELHRLVTSLRRAQEYFLFFASCNQVPRQNELIAQAQAALFGKHITSIRFREPITDLLDELRTILADKKPDAVFVQGLENSISSDGTGRANDLIHALNLSRDSFKDALSCPMVLWLPEYAIVKITRHAPDFFSVRSGVFYFSQAAETVIGQIFQSASFAPLEISSLPVAEKQQRMATLESLLAEYQGLHPERRDKNAELRLNLQLAIYFDSLAEYRKAIVYNKRALTLAQEIGDHQSEGKALNRLGLGYAALGEVRRAIKFYEQCLALSREISDRHSEGAALGNLGLGYAALGDLRPALELYEQHLVIARELGDRQSEGTALGNLGNAYAALGEVHRALEFYAQCLAIAHELGDRQSEGNTLGNLGIAYKQMGEMRHALEFFEQHRVIARELGDRLGEGIALTNMSWAYYEDLGEKARGLALAQDALRIYETIESPYAATVRGWLAEWRAES